ncbi:ATP-binding protein [Termitidicoccus mucosus]
MDDIVLATTGRLDALQLKHSTSPKGITLASLLKPSAEGKLSLIRQLADGWRALKKAHPDRVLSARLVFRGMPTGLGQLDDQIAVPEGENFHRFLLEGWGIHSKPEDLAKWNSLREAIIAETNLARDEVAVFFEECGIEFVNPTTPMDTSWAESDLDTLTNHLLKIAAADVRPGKIDQDTLLQGLEWNSRFQIRYSHEWKIDERYQSIHATTEPLINLLASIVGGYAALLGTPGSGKSTTLSHTLRKTGDWRFIPYYAYLPGDISQGRGEAVQFLHDLVLSLHRHGFRGRRGYATEELTSLRNELTDLFGELGEDFRKTGRRTVILVDGLDHIPREQTTTISLLSVLPHPDSIPSGVLFFLGSQTLALPRLSPAIQVSLEKENRIVRMSPMSRGEIRAFVERSQLAAPLDTDQFTQIESLSEGHPLSLALLVERLRPVKDCSEVNSILENAPAYGGHIENSYQVFWESIRRDSETRRMLARWARLQGSFALPELLEVFESTAVEKALETARPYLRVTGAETVDFFHNSFRQFVLTETRKSNLGIDENATIHRELSNLFAALPARSPLGWEAAYHARMAGAQPEALALSSPGRLRAQYLENRPIRGIFQDINAAVEITGRKDERAEAMGLLLNWQEFYQRARSTEQHDHVVLIYRLYGAQAVRRHIESKGWLTVGAKAAWQLCKALWESGEQTHAREVYEIAEPMGALTGQTAVEIGFHDESDGDFGEWAKLALNFRPLDEIIAGIGRLRAGKHHFGGQSNPEIKTARLRSDVLGALAKVFADRDDWLTVERLRAAVPEPQLRRWQLNLDWHMVHRHPKHAKTIEALSRLEVAYASEPEMAAELAEMLWRVTGDRARVVTWIERASQPESPVKDEVLNSGPKVRERLILTRILATVRLPVDVEKIVPEISGKRRYGSWLFDRAVTKLAILWGEGRAGKNYEPSELRIALRPLLRLYHHSHKETRDWGSWHDSAGRRKEYFEWVVRAVAAHGAEAVAVVGEEFDQIWENEQESTYWSASLRRDVAKRLYQHDGNLDAFRRRLDDSSRASANRSFLLDEISYELTDIVETWLLASAPDKARATYRQFLELSFAIPEKDGGSALEWIIWWERSLDGDRGKFAAGALHLGRLLERLHDQRRGEDLDDAGAAFLQILAQRDLALTHQYAVRFLDAGFQTFCVAVAADILSILKTVPAEADFAIVLATALLVPCATGTHENIARAIADLPARDRAIDECRRELIDAVETLALPRMRNAWMERLQGNTGTTHEETDDTDETEANDEFQKKDNEALQRWRTLNSAEAFLAAFREHSTAQESIFVNHDRRGYVLDRIPKKDWSTLFEAGLREDWSPLALSAFARELRAQGLHAEAAQIAGRAFATSDAKGWSEMRDGGTRLRPAKEWVASGGAEARATVFRQWIEDYAAGNAYAPATPASLRELCELFLERPPWAHLWKEMAEQQLALAEVRCEPLPFVESASAITPQQIAEHWIMWCAELPVPELHDAAFKALRSLGRDPRHYPWVHGVYARYLEINDETQCEALALLTENAELTAEAPVSLVNRCRELVNHPSAVVRDYALAAIEKWPEAKATVVESSRSELPVIYRLVLPPIQMKEFSLPMESYPKGAPPMETEDRYEWVLLYKAELETIADHSGIPFQNLVWRLTDLMLAADRATWSAEAEKKLIDRLDYAGLKLPYRRLRGQAASLALVRVLAELYDASRIDFDLYQALGVTLNPIDKVISAARPVTMPPEIVVPETRYLKRYDPIPWNTLPQDPLDVCVRKMRDGRAVIAELSRFRYWDRSLPTEIRSSVIIPVTSEAPPTWREDYGFVATNHMWRADAYPMLPGTGAISSPAVGGNDFGAMVGSGDWVAFNSAIARALKWRRRAGSMFGWENADGILQVETIWWSRGPYYRVDTHQEALSAQGWLIVATPDAVKSFKAITPLFRRAAVQRTTSGRDREPSTLLERSEELADSET